jgi:hypothetical protein
MNPIWLLRMKRWVQHPPSLRRVILVVGVVAVCFAIAGVEAVWGWPDWLVVNKVRR